MDNQVLSNNRQACLPLGAPTIVRKGKRVMLVLTQTIDESKAPSVCFFNVVENAYFKDDAIVVQEAASFETIDGVDVNGKVDYEIPGAEAFLGVDEDEQNFYFLSNRAFSNPDSKMIDPIEARLSAPPLVRKIPWKTLKELKSLQEQHERD